MTDTIKTNPPPEIRGPWHFGEIHFHQGKRVTFSPCIVSVALEICGTVGITARVAVDAVTLWFRFNVRPTHPLITELNQHSQLIPGHEHREFTKQVKLLVTGRVIGYDVDELDNEQNPPVIVLEHAEVEVL